MVLAVAVAARGSLEWKQLTAALKLKFQACPPPSAPPIPTTPNAPFSQLSKSFLWPQRGHLCPFSAFYQLSGQDVEALTVQAGSLVCFKARSEEGYGPLYPAHAASQAGPSCHGPQAL